MEFKRPAGAQHCMGKEQEEYFNIWARAEIATFAEPNGDTYQAHRMVVCFEPTPDELVRLNAGESIYLSIMGQRFPPISVTVGDPNPEYAADAHE